MTSEFLELLLSSILCIYSNKEREVLEELASLNNTPSRRSKTRLKVQHAGM